MATLYWGGGTGTWTGFSGNNWYADVERTTLFSRAPCALDDVIFDSASSAANYTVTVSADACCRSCTFLTPAAGVTLTLAGSSALSVYGDITFPASGFSRTYTGTIQLLGTGSRTITTNGAVVGAFSVLGTGTYVMQDALTSVSTINVGAGVFDTNGFNLTCTSLTAPTAETSGTIRLRSSVVSLSGSISANAPLVIDAGTSTINFSGTAPSIGAGTGYLGNTFYNVNFTSFAITTSNFYGNNTFNTLTFSEKNSDTVTNIVLWGGQTVGTLTLSGQLSVRRYFVRSGLIGVQRALSVGNYFPIVDVDFRDIAAAGTALFSGTRLGDCGGNSGIYFPAAKTVYWNAPAGGVWTSTSWAATSGGAVDAANFPLAQDTAVIDNLGLGASATISAVNGYNVGTLTCTKTGLYTISGNGLSVYGNVTLSGGVSTTALSLLFCGRGNQSFIPVAGTLNVFSIQGHNSSVVLGGALTVSTLSITSGGLNTNGYSFTATTPAVSTITTGVNPYSFALTLGASTASFGGSGLSSSSPKSALPTFTVNAGTSTVNLTASGSIGFIDQALAWNNVAWTTNFANTIAIRGTCTFNRLTFKANSVGAIPVTLGGNTTVGTLDWGAAIGITARITVASDVVGTQRTLSVASFAGSFANIDFMDIAAAGAAAWASGTSIGDCGGNSGITFTPARTLYWNRSINTDWYNALSWALTSGGTPDGTALPLPQDTAVFNDTGSAATVRFDYTTNVGTINASGRTAAMTIAGNGAISVHGDLTLGSGVTVSSTAQLRPRKRGTQTFNTAGKSTSWSLTLECPATDFRHASGGTFGAIVIYAGTYSTQNYSIGCSGITLAAIFGVPVTANFGTSTFTISGSSPVTATASESLTINASSAAFSCSSATVKSFRGGGYSYGTLTNSGNGNLIVFDSNTFGNVSASASVPFILTYGTTQTITNFSLNGFPGNPLRVYTTMPGQTATIKQSPTGASLAAAGVNSIDGGNNTNFVFGQGTARDYLYLKDLVYSGDPPPSSSRANFLMFL